MSLFFSPTATAVAGLAFIRTVFQGRPIVEFLVERDASGLAGYKLSVSNPTRRRLFLDYIEVLSPSTATGFTSPEHSVRDTAKRACDEDERAAGQTKSVFLAVPAGETKCLEIVFKNNMNDEDFDVDFRLVWSKGLPFLDRWLMPRKVRLDSTQVKSRNLAAVEGGKD